LNGELTLNIAGLLKPWRQGLDPKEIYREVGEYIELLTSVSNEHLRPDGGLTKDHAKALLDAVVRLEKQIERAAEESPEMRIRTRGVDFGWLREECEDAIKAAHSKRDRIKEQCAKSALHLNLKFCDEQPTSGSRESRFRKLTTLVYQAVTGGIDCDLERACENALRPYREIISTEYPPK